MQTSQLVVKHIYGITAIGAWQTVYAMLCQIFNDICQLKFFQQKLQGPVVQSIVSLTSSLRDQLVKCFTTLSPNTLKFFVEKMREAFALQKLLTFFQQKILVYLRY